MYRGKNKLENYIIKVEDFISAQSFILEENSYAYVMPKSRSIDIDDI